jgi:hypothetical protein
MKKGMALPPQHKLRARSKMRRASHRDDCDAWDDGIDSERRDKSVASLPTALIARPQDLLMRIVGLQNLDGSWSDVDALVLLTGKSLDDFHQLRSEVGAAFATVLGVAVLRHFCSERQSAWSLVEQKALSWLAPKLGGIASAEALIAGVIAIL